MSKILKSMAKKPPYGINSEENENSEENKNVEKNENPEKTEENNDSK